MAIDLENNLDATSTASPTQFPLVRMRRLRGHAKLRELIKETRLSVQDLVAPIFVTASTGQRQPIAAMPGHFRFSVDQLDQEIRCFAELNIPAVLLFGLPEYKDAQGSAAVLQQGVVQQAIRRIKEISPQTLIIADLCFCGYTDHGHCGVVHEKNGKVEVANDETLILLAAQAVSLAAAGADVIAPSGMMDGMVRAIRNGLDQAGYREIPILSYAVKFASAFYGPFREAAQCAPKMADRKGYQMDPANGREALREAQLDIAEGADMLMVKPALAYLDIISRIKGQFPEIPLAAYQVSGEYSMIKAAAANGWVDETLVMMESLTAIKRAGTDFIITYFAKDVARLLDH